MFSVEHINRWYSQKSELNITSNSTSPTNSFNPTNIERESPSPSVSKKVEGITIAQFESFCRKASALELAEIGESLAKPATDRSATYLRILKIAERISSP